MSIVNDLFPDGLPADLKAWGIVMPQAARDTLVALHDAQGWHLHRVTPVPLTDGRWSLSADVLSEAHPSGLFSGIALITPEMLNGVEILPWSEILTLLPTPPEDIF